MSVLHSCVNHPTNHRRYSVSAYEFEPEPPFRLLSITEPVLRASGNDPIKTHALVPWWNPLVVFPCSAQPSGSGWLLCGGVNDTCNATFLLTRLCFHDPGSFANKRLFYFRTDSANGVVVLSGRQRLRWEPYGYEVGGVRSGKLVTSDPETIDALLGKHGVTHISKDEYDSLR